MKTKLWLPVALLFVAFIPAGGRAAFSSEIGNTAWKSAADLGRDPNFAYGFGRLRQVSEARWFRFNVSKSSELTLTLETSRRAKIEPRLVVFEPSPMTIGPALPIAQPPDSLAVVYPTNLATGHRDNVFSPQLLRRSNQTVTLNEFGQYYLAVYNAGPASGAFRITVKAPGQSPTWWSGLNLWWATNTWFGPSGGAFVIPLLLIAAALLAWIIVTRMPRRPSPIKFGASRRRTVSHARVS